MFDMKAFELLMQLLYIRTSSWLADHAFALTSLNDELRILLCFKIPHAKSLYNFHAISTTSYSAMLLEHGLVNVDIGAVT